MDRQELDNFKTWFSGFCSTFYTPIQADQKNILLKEQHTWHVCANMTEIALSLALSTDKMLLAEAVALFHDVGRFPQYGAYRTYNDRLSANHAALGAKALIENKVLGHLSKQEQDHIIRAVTLHNVYTIPDGLDPDLLLLVKMVRDADKLDIWRVFIEFYRTPDEDRASAVALGLPDNGDYSQSVLNSFAKKEMVHLSALVTLNDFKLLQLSWIFDLHFKRSLELVRERNIIDQIAVTLPRQREIDGAIEMLHEYVSMKINADYP